MATQNLASASGVLKFAPVGSGPVPSTGRAWGAPAASVNPMMLRDVDNGSLDVTVQSGW